MIDVIAEQSQTIELLEAELRVKRAAISRMQRDRNSQVKLDPSYADAEEVFGYWRKKLAPTAREFSGKRLEAVLARLHAGHTVADLKLAIDGCAEKPYVVEGGRRAKTGRPEERHVELELICRSETKVQRFAALVDRPQPAVESPISEPQVVGYQRAMTDEIKRRLWLLRRWDPQVITALGLGLDGARVVFPTRDGNGLSVGLVRYSPNAGTRAGPKSISEGPRELFPAPETIVSPHVWLVEGEPDVVAARSVGIEAVGVPGVSTWKDGWAERFDRFERVVICFDSDKQGREAAAARQRALATVTRTTLVDLAPDREDGYDLGDLVIEHGDQAAAMLLDLARHDRSTQVLPLQPRLGDQSPFDKVCDALRERDCLRDGPVPASGKVSARCPNHDDRAPSLSVSEARDGKVLLHCFTGCPPDEVLAALGMQWTDAFPRAI